MTPLHDSSELCINEGPGLLVFLMRRSPDDAAFGECRKCLSEVAARQARINLVFLIPTFDGHTRATRPAQKAFVTTLGDLNKHLVATCIAITVPGLKGTMLRLTVNAVLMLGKLRNPIQIHAALPAMVTWLRSLPGQLPAVLSAPELLQDLQRIHATGERGPA